MTPELSPSQALPQDAHQALLVGRLWQPGVGPILVQVRPDGIYDLSGVASTCSELLERPDLVATIRAHSGSRLGDVAAVLANSDATCRQEDQPWFLAPCDLQALKAAGVTFVASMLERVIEEQARGDASKAAAVRAAVVAIMGDNLSLVKPGSEQAAQLKQALLAQNAWSQYLEVGIGPDAEVFTKSQPLSALGTGAEVGLHPRSEWNNPEPEIVLAANSRGEVVGATLGNDVNLRDFEGRSALLLGKAKDNNGSCAIGPFIRLFDETFSIDSVRRCTLSMEVRGTDGFVMQGSSSLAMISRDPLDLAAQAMGSTHQYPDGMMLFLGTMFAPTQDRPIPGRPAGQGFTHVVGDVVRISTPDLGTLVNRVNTSDRIPPWTYGVRSLMQDLAQRNLKHG
ncbi:MAG: fumarylacetoacetate hydrolase family protein [Limnohabitans sp.]|jgi:fumarylacetoacetate (FAA) hydrolase family protein|nr:fumarylacetoacetate hydrolase family protein [Limnohabitans sp.]